MADIAGLIYGNFWEEPTPEQRRFAEHVAKQIEAAIGSTIAEQKKRIGELDDDLRQIGRAEACHLEEIAELREALTAERRRREECEAELREEGFRFACGDAAKAHLTRYPSDAENESADGRRG